jgi:Protein of unknown function (DUF541)
MPEPAASPTADQPTVTVVGEGMASAVPDTALLHLGVETRGTTPGEALEACSRALEEVIAAVRAAGVEPPRLATGELSVHPDWEVNPAGPAAPRRLSRRRPADRSAGCAGAGRTGRDGGGHRGWRGCPGARAGAGRGRPGGGARRGAGCGVAGCSRPSRAVCRAGRCRAGPGPADRGDGRQGTRAAAGGALRGAGCRRPGRGGG